jgi:hypothetical protein
MDRSIAEDGRTEPERDGIPAPGCVELGETSVITPSARRRVSLVLFLTALLFCSWFFHVGDVNQIARYDAVNAFFENTGDDAHTFRIDRYLYSESKHLNTSDWSEYGGHYYSNKSPGTTWFGVVLLAPIYPLERRICPDGDGISPRAEIFNAWYLNFIMGVLPTAFSVLALAGILLKLGAGEARAYPGALLIVLGTAVFPFSTTLMAHSSVAAYLVFSLWSYLRGGRFSLVASGAWFGAAVLFDYSAGLLLPLAIIFLLCREKGRIWQFLAGGIPFAVLYCVYNAMCFGGPFSFAAQHINPVYRTEGDAAGGLLALPNAWLVLELLFGARRGILLASPFLFFAVRGFVSLWKQGGLRRGLALLTALSLAALLLMNASFNGWHSGASFTARYMVPVVPFIGVLAVMAPLGAGWRRALFGLLAVISLLNMFAVVAYTVTPPEPDPSPIYVSSYLHLMDRTPLQLVRTQLGLQALRPDAATLRAAARFTLGGLAGMPYGVSKIVIFLIGILAWVWLLLLGCGPSAAAPVCGTDDRDGGSRSAVAAGVLFRERWNAVSAPFHDLLLKRQVGLWGVLACCAAAAALLLPGDIPFSYGAELQVHMAAFDAVDAHTFANPFGKWGFAALFYQMLYLFSKDIVLIAFLKTALSLAACFLLLNDVAKRSKLSAPILILFATVSPYLLLAHRSLRGDSLLLPAGAFMLFALVRLVGTDGGSRLKRIALLLGALLVWSLLWLRTPAGYVPMRGPFAVLQATFCGFADLFYPGLGSIDGEAGTFLALMTLVSVVFTGALLLTGSVLVLVRRDRAGIVSLVLVLLASLSFLAIRRPYHPFHWLYAVPFTAYLEATGAAWFLTGRPARAAKIVLGVNFVLCLCGWLVFLGAIHRDAGNRSETFGVTLTEQQAGAMHINSELRHYAPDPFEVTARNDAERRMFYPIGWLTVLDSIRDPYVQFPNAAPAPGFFVSYRDGSRAPTGYLRILTRFKDDGKLLGKMPVVPEGATPAD